MVWELHVWGPAFSLPSIDAQCLATIAYFTQAVPKGQWVLVASSDPALSPTKDLPALRDGATWIGGFRNILDYVRQYSHGEWDLDWDLSPQEKADCIAFSSFLEAHGQPLLDFSLYVSSQNYHAATRPAYASILPWPSQWITPPNRRAAARARTQHLGLSSLDLDRPTDPTTGDRTTDVPSGADQIPASLLRRPRETVTSLLTAPQRRHHMRLHTLTTRFLQPLQERLGKKKFFFAENRPSSLDCLVVGYLALALFPDLPQAWLAEAIRTGFGRLGGYVHNLVGPFFGGAVSVEKALAGGACSTEQGDQAEAEAETERDQRPHEQGALPWKAPDRGGLLAIGSLVLENVIDSIPLVDQLRASNRLERAAKESSYMTEEEKKQVQAVATARRRELFSQVVTVGAGVSAFVGYLFYNGIISWSTGEEEEVGGDKRNLADMGEAGAMLAMANYTDGTAAGG